MAKLKKYNLAGKEIGHVAVDDAFVSVEANGQMIKDYIVALQANARQWSAHTKTRGTVAHTTKKPHAQKGTGRARQGTLVAPQHRGGGRAHGPKAKFDQHVRINKKERRKAIQFLIAEKIREDKIRVVDDFALDAPRTQQVAEFIDMLGFDGRVLFLGHAEDSANSAQTNFKLSMRNIPGTHFMPATQISGYDVLVAQDLVVTEAGWREIIEWLS